MKNWEQNKELHYATVKILEYIKKNSLIFIPKYIYVLTLSQELSQEETSGILRNMELFLNTEI